MICVLGHLSKKFDSNGDQVVEPQCITQTVHKRLTVNPFDVNTPRDSRADPAKLPAVGADITGSRDPALRITNRCHERRGERRRVKVARENDAPQRFPSEG